MFVPLIVPQKHQTKFIYYASPETARRLTTPEGEVKSEPPGQGSQRFHFEN